jgi:plastocyanin
MSKSVKITMTNNAGKTVFAPDPANLNPNDSVFWVNNDDRGDVNGAHQLGPVGGPATDWMRFPILPGAGGQSPLVVFSKAGEFPYTCFVQGHQNESGTIIVGSPSPKVS